MLQQPKLMLPVGHTSFINSLQFSADAKKIITASADCTDKILDVASGKLIAYPKHNEHITPASFSPDEKK